MALAVVVQENPGVESAQAADLEQQDCAPRAVCHCHSPLNPAALHLNAHRIEGQGLEVGNQIPEWCASVC